MKGYNSIKQFVEDYKLYMAAKKIDPGKEGETITSYLRKRVKKRLSAASKQFKAMIKKRGYSMIDLMLIGTHDSIKSIYDLESFVKECFGVDYVTKLNYKKLMSSNAFKNGRLKKLYEFIPLKIETKIDLIRFIRIRIKIPKEELAVIMNNICSKNWHAWMNELIYIGKLRDKGGSWFA